MNIELYAERCADRLTPAQRETSRRVLRNIVRTSRRDDNLFGNDTARRIAILNDLGVCENDYEFKKVDCTLERIPPGQRYRSWGLVTDVLNAFRSRSMEKEDYDALRSVDAVRYLEQVLAHDLR